VERERLVDTWLIDKLSTSNAEVFIPRRELPSDETRPPELSKALVFDVFETIVDWRTSLVGELKALEEKHAVAAGQSLPPHFNICLTCRLNGPQF